MEERRTVVLYGNSLLMAGMEVSLRHQPGLDVVRIDAPLPNAVQRLSALQPDVVIFDLAAPNSPFSNLHFPSSILQERPGISLIGLDLNSNKVLVLSGQEHNILAAKDLAQVIQLLTRC
jgi:DNA-binding NarL/FixJ family response regulator